MKVGHTTGMEVPEALMPENAELIACKVPENVGGIIRRIKKEFRKGRSRRIRRRWRRNGGR
jgi:hypothetical protein